MRSSSALHDQFQNERQQLKEKISDKLATQMAGLLHHRQTADLLLVSADGRKLPAHLCILRRRAPVFCQRYIEPTLSASARPIAGRSPLEVAVGDVDSAGLAFFVRSVYTDDEISQLPPDELNIQSGDDDKSGGPSGSRRRDGDARYEPKRSGFHDGLRDEIARESPSANKPHNSRKGSANESLNNSKTHLNDMTNFPVNESVQMPIGMSASFPSPQDLKDFPMTSFAEIAHASQQSLDFCGDSPMCLSTYSDVEESRRRSRSVTSEVAGNCKYIRLDESVASQSSSRSESQTRNYPPSKSFFYTIGSEENAMTQSAPTNDSGSIRTRAMLARRLSVSSLTSLTSIDLTPTNEAMPPAPDRAPASQLGADLLSLYLDGTDSDVTVIADNEEKLKAHRCILWATCPAFHDQLSGGKTVNLSSYSKSTVHFLLSFLYGGLSCVTDDVDNIWELAKLADELKLEELIEVVILNFRSYRCHFFHRPCASCVSAICDALPKFYEHEGLKPLRDDALVWQAKHFARIWKGRVFLHLAERWQRECFDALLSSINEETVVDVLLGCEKLQIALPRLKTQSASQFVQRLVADTVEFCTDFLVSAFDGVIASKSFVQQGRGLALNLSLLEDILPTLVHSLTADTAIRSFICLKQLLAEIAEQTEQQRSEPRGSSLSLQQEDFNPRFVHLCRRLFDLADKHLLHYAASVVQADAWTLLTSAEQSRIQTEGIFVEMRASKAPFPRLSSFNRSYKRSSSVGFTSSNGTFDRARSLERPRPVATFAQLLEADEPMEAIIEREKSQTQIQLHRRSGSENLSTRQKQPDVSKIPAKTKRVERHTTEETSEKQPVTSPTNEHPSIALKKSNEGNRSSTNRTVVTKKSVVPSPTRRQPAKHPPPVSQNRPLPTSQTTELERQDTQTIMTSVHPKANLPEVFTASTETLVISPTPTQSITSNEASKHGKPRSVVKPMPKATVLPTTQTRKSTATTPTTSTAAKVNTRSALPTRRVSPPASASRSTAPLSIDGRPRRETKIPQSPGKRRRAKQ
ncbi:BTB/POZ domain-containing protein 8 [Aphelenchoides besseyi]|nr:BTB/POZ domain-containing protein 8 [Aphelenchoides besseyi]